MRAVDLDDLRERMERAVANLEASRESYHDQANVNRLAGKIEGVKLALSYLADQPDLDPPVVRVLPAELVDILEGRTLTFDGAIKVRIPTPNECLEMHRAATASLGIEPSLTPEQAHAMCRPISFEGGMHYLPVLKDSDV